MSLSRTGSQCSAEGLACTQQHGATARASSQSRQARHKATLQQGSSPDMGKATCGATAQRNNPNPKDTSAWCPHTHEGGPFTENRLNFIHVHQREPR